HIAEINEFQSKLNEKVFFSKEDIIFPQWGRIRGHWMLMFLPLYVAIIFGLVAIGFSVYALTGKSPLLW
ncbi:MAG: hypothetical protein ACXAB4_13775, partial [Candidatus Hodarchaeales archaeon]